MDKRYFRLFGAVLALVLLGALAITSSLWLIADASERQALKLQASKLRAWHGKVEEWMEEYWLRGEQLPLSTPLQRGFVAQDFARRFFFKGPGSVRVVACVGAACGREHAILAAAVHSGAEIEIKAANTDSISLQWAASEIKKSMLIVDCAGGSEEPMLLKRALARATTHPTFIVVRFDPSLQVNAGASTLEELWKKGYKAQLLASSHDLGDDLGPSALLTRPRMRLLTTRSLLTKAEHLVFATKGLELAIPSIRPYSGLEDSCAGRAMPATSCLINRLFERTAAHSRAPSCPSSPLIVRWTDDERWQAACTKNQKTKISSITALHARQFGPGTVPCFRASCNGTEAVACGVRNNANMHFGSLPKGKESVAVVRLEGVSEAQLFRKMPELANTVKRRMNAPPHFSQVDLDAIVAAAASLPGARSISISDECGGAGNTKDAPRLNSILCTLSGVDAFKRPNCGAGRLMAEYALDEARNFVSSASKNGHPFALTVTLVDGNEDSGMLARVLDSPATKFVNQLIGADVRVIVTSSGGVSFGAFAQTPAGRIEAQTPFTYASWAVSNSPLGFAKEKERQKRKSSSCEFARPPPSPLSFYADIAKGAKRRTQCVSADSPKSTLHINGSFGVADGELCHCATTTREWTKCASLGGKLSAEDDYLLAACDDRMDVHLRVARRRKILERRRKAVRSGVGDDENDLSVLILQLDSVSSLFWVRHSRRTRAVLEDAELARRVGLKSLKFEKSSVSGAASIVNQLALLSGCVGADADDPTPRKRGLVKVAASKTSPSHLKLNHRVHVWCDDKSAAVREFGEFPWLHAAAAEKGYVTMFGEELCSTDSPWTLPTHFLDTVASFDHTIDEMHCRKRHLGFTSADHISEALWYAAAKEMYPDLDFKWQIGWDSDHACFEGKLKHEWPLSQLRNLWNAYPDVPKFAFISSAPAHDYSPLFSSNVQPSEAFDEVLADFVREMMHRDDAHKTVLLIHSDHGLQGGPLATEFSTQAEHRNPFAYLVYPLSMDDDEIARSASSSLLTPFDLHKTLAGVIGARSGPSWAYDVLRERVPENRTCDEAFIPVEYCPCMNENIEMKDEERYPGGSPHAPRPGVCNFVENEQRPHCVEAYVSRESFFARTF